jgi:ElaA protein
MKFVTKKFKDLQVNELYDLLRLRSEIFVVEQNCVYQDMDEKDKKSLHVLGIEKGKIVAYARLVPPGVSYPESPSIGRVVVDQKHRGKKHAYKLMEYAIKETLKKFKTDTITISAQLYLKEFYTRTGFQATGKVYPEDNIPHIKMILEK